MKLRHNDGNTSKSVLEIYAISAIRTFRLKQGKEHKTTLTPVDGLGAWMAMKGERVVRMTMMMVARVHCKIMCGN